jgi:7beta-hydroxy-3-oxochol-24-oyl-CoA 4-desaturase
MTAFKHLFTPIKIGVVEIKNRIVMPPMGSRSATPEGEATERHCDYYEARAKGGTGLVIVEAATPNRERKYAPGALGLFDDSLIPGLERVASRIHAHGAKACIQIFDPGPGSGSMAGGKPSGPSMIWDPGIRETPSELSVAEIKQLIREFTDAARRAKAAGMDMVQLHAAHRFAMLAAFLSAYYNKRADAYGGSLADRVTLLLEIIRSIKAENGSDFPIIVRLSGEERVAGGRTLAETQFIAPIIAEAGADALEISGGTVPDGFWAVVPPSGTQTPLNADAAEAIKKVVDIPVISVGRINHPRLAEFILHTGKADLVSIGRGLIADPDFANKAKAGRIEDIVPCVGDSQHCLEGHPVRGHLTCMVNPAVMREKEMLIVPAEKAKKVLIVGGGPAGLEAARVSALRGHDVTLYEKSNRLGGQINIAAVPLHKQELIRMLKYLSCQIEKLGVKTVLGWEATVSDIEALKPDVVVIATGAEPILAEAIPGSRGNNVVTVWDVLSGKAGMTSRNIAIVGGSMSGCEAADMLANIGDNAIVGRTRVTIIEMTETVAMDCSTQIRQLLMERLRHKDVTILNSTQVKAIGEYSVTVESGGKETVLEGFDLIVLALGSRSVDVLSDPLKGKAGAVYVIGDAVKPGKVREAMEQARELGGKI